MKKVEMNTSGSFKHLNDQDSFCNEDFRKPVKQVLIEKVLFKQRLNDAELKPEWLELVQIGSTIEFTWWDLYGKGREVRKIKDVSPSGKPIVKFQGGDWVIEWVEIKQIY
jgi:hypothetical protein|tara:strand:+ start:268 stop:597 length:330 start_codon:yes stop_codon:yes gene_type:complete